MADELRDTTWVLSGPIVLPEGVEVTLALLDGDMSGYSGCNRFHGGFHHDHDVLEFGGIASTMMMCSDEAMAVEREVLERLGATAFYVLGESTLTMQDDQRRALLRFVEQDDSSIKGRWRVIGIHHPDRHAIISARGDLSLEIADGHIGGNGGCNTFRGGIQVSEGVVSIGPLLSTRRFCGDADTDADGGPTVMEQEAALLAALEHTTSLRLESRRLTLLRADGGIAVSLQRA